jgi:hypothetical protein
MKYAVEMGSDVMIYIPSFIKIGSGIQKLMGARDIHADRHTDSKVISYAYYYFFKIRKADQKTDILVL